ncbi:MAG: sulfite exporter TauE/SafE family protein [Rhodobacter sp.]|nr:sulfite exporter TauE/SafE family protein [Rhodobacter sp.]
MASLGLLWAVLGLAAGGVLKGAIGAGSPIIAVPILALLYDVPTAVALFTLPNLFSNLWQGWTYRAHQISRRFVWTFAGAGALGALVGSVLLAYLPGDMLLAVVAMVVFVYIGVRLTRPNWILSRASAAKLAGAAGLIGGVMQGAGGISAPVSVTFLNAMRLERAEFIATISIFFATMAVVQIPALWTLGILTPDRAILSLAAGIPLFGGMPVGAWLARRIAREKFDRIILWLLALIALRLLYGAIF